jgi:cysteinyl-tRNA synthetase
LEDFFGFDVFFVINITDIDDKIILRARQNYLLKQYLDKNPPLDEIVSYANEQLRLNLDELRAKESILRSKIDSSAKCAKALRDDLDTVTCKIQRLNEQRRILDAASKPSVDAGAPSAATLLEHVGELVAQRLDAAAGAAVEDAGVFRAHAHRYEREFLDDMRALGVRPPDAMARVSEHVPEIVAFIQRIAANGFAYEAAGSVYFDLRAFAAANFTYRKLSARPAPSSRPAPPGVPPEPAAAAAGPTDDPLDGGDGGDDAAAGAGEKRWAGDFVLWKRARPGEPRWDSPWGPGRPGWHIECSAMASKLLGDVLDVHGGGVDLCFPHHDNELAQVRPGPARRG